jgi:hypothetical protein
MSWTTEWRALSARIASLLDAGHFFAQILQVYSSDMYGGASVLLSSATEIYRALKSYYDRHTATLPLPARECLRLFFSNCHAKFESEVQGRDAQFQVVQFRLTALKSLQSELTYLLADTEVVAKNLATRAFLHLQRAIVADVATRRTWREAFETGEPACERLGANHLLLHGIWAFKAHSEGERTDLVLGERLQVTPQIESAAQALVLTEWKLVREPSELSAKAEEAFKQAKLYGVGSLAGFEVKTKRYLVMVSRHRIEMPPNRTDADIEYEFVNIAVEPSVPSSEARK